ncbi:MAG: ADP-forming succinate--CoA ligase subunit beta [Candidatus Omnitrophica bacterium]|nr:ADP-forming succinate--CoA ligase subunit beta [Candidatus Omnitrophota bacterium]
MNIHEYQAKEIFHRYAIPVNLGKIARSEKEAFDAAHGIEAGQPGCLFAVKAQVHAGGRGKGGGIKIRKNAGEVARAAAEMLGTRLVTPQSGSEGKPVDRVLIEGTSAIAKEYYASVVLDRSEIKPCLIVSEAGGMDIEEVAANEPEKILKQYFSLEEGLGSAEAEALARRIVKDKDHALIFSRIFQSLAKLFLELDASLVEVNPLAVLENGKVVAIDAKINFDVNALYRHPDIAALRDSRQEDPREVEAKKFDLSYVGLEGNIGCIVNGAGLAMATMDIVKYYGGEPANFLDVGGGANKDKVTAAFKIILRDPSVKAILVNIFGGIMRCDVVAEGILAAVSEVGVKVPLVVRLEGTNVKEGKEILKKSNLNIITASEFAEAAEKVVAAL